MGWLKRLIGGGKEEATQPEPAKPTIAPRPADRAALLADHQRNTALRKAALEELFGCQVTSIVTDDELRIVEDDPAIVDVFVWEVNSPSQGEISILVTNGLSNRRMVDPDDPDLWDRRELIQYIRNSTPGHVKRLRDMAWAALEEPLYLDVGHTIAWHRAAVEGTPWTSAFFLRPLMRNHQEFEMTVGGDPVSLLWHIPISEREREFKVQHGMNALIDRLEAVELPWVFDEANRPPLVD